MTHLVVPLTWTKFDIFNGPRRLQVICCDQITQQFLRCCPGHAGGMLVSAGSHIIGNAQTTVIVAQSQVPTANCHSSFWISCKANKARYRLYKLKKQIKWRYWWKFIYQTFIEHLLCVRSCCIPRDTLGPSPFLQGAYILAEHSEVPQNGVQKQPLQLASPDIWCVTPGR